MRRHVMPLLGLTMTAMLAACSGGGSTAAPPATDAPASQAPASEAPAASEPGGSGTGGCAPSSEAGAVEVAIQGFAFSPAAIEAAVGETIAFTNNDEAPHTATLDEGDCSTDSLGNGATGGLVFDAPGTYPFHCRIHPNMTGTITISGSGSVEDGY